MLAADSARQLGEHVRLDGATVLDVGGGRGTSPTPSGAPARSPLGLEPDAGEMVARGEPQPGTVRGSGEALPVRTAAVDVCYSSNVLEHVRSPWQMTSEMVRVTRPGGTVFLSFTPWWSPHGGHETGPWHYLGGHRARRRYRRRNGQGAEQFGESLFRVSVGEALRWAHLPGRGGPRDVPAVPPVVGRLAGAGPGTARDRVLESRRRDAAEMTWGTPVAQPSGAGTSPYHGSVRHPVG